jgi:hypothetical protein
VATSQVRSASLPQRLVISKNIAVEDDADDVTVSSVTMT